MAVLESPTNPAALAEVDPGMRALRATLRPPEASGAFRIGEFSGLLTAAAANGYLFYLRNPDPNKLIVLNYLRLRMAVITSFTAAQELAFDAVHLRTWSLATAGGTPIAVANNNLKKRASLAASIGDMRIATTAGLTAPTAVVDANPFIAGMAKTLAAAATVQDIAFDEEFDATNGTDFPVIYAGNEGLAVRNKILMGAVGTVRLAVTAGWTEVPALGSPFG